MTQSPIFKASIGAIHCSVWANTSQDGAITRHSTDIIRSYKDKHGEWCKSSSFSHDELLNVAKLAQRAEEFIARTKYKQQD